MIEQSNLESVELTSGDENSMSSESTESKPFDNSISSES